MTRKREILAAALADSPDLCRKLDQMLRDPGDAAYVVCEYDDCVHNVAGRCSIYAIRDRGTEPCSQYRKRN
ncbi:MAG TPA: hypothetical protein VIU41_12290 [Geobacteraceae bacterium]